jgi:hypothetical protein
MSSIIRGVIRPLTESCTDDPSLGASLDASLAGGAGAQPATTASRAKTIERNRHDAIMAAIHPDAFAGGRKVSPAAGRRQANAL